VGANLSSIGLIIGSNALFTIGACCVACDEVAAAMICAMPTALLLELCTKAKINVKEPTWSRHFWVVAITDGV